MTELMANTAFLSGIALAAVGLFDILAAPVLLKKPVREISTDTSEFSIKVQKRNKVILLIRICGIVSITAGLIIAGIGVFS